MREGSTHRERQTDRESEKKGYDTVERIKEREIDR